VVLLFRYQQGPLRTGLSTPSAPRHPGRRPLLLGEESQRLRT
jgi:hypothetical protein